MSAIDGNSGNEFSIDLTENSKIDENTFVKFVTIFGNEPEAKTKILLSNL